MATYVNDLRLKEIATGDEAGTWGTSTNTNLELIGEALGYGTQDCFASDADATTTVADGASDPARAMYFKVTSSATLTATRTLTIAPNTISRVMLIENATTGSQSITISQGSGSTVTIASGAVKMVYLDGAGAGGAVVEALADLELPTVTVADLTATTADINAGTIDNTVIGGSTPAAVTTSSLVATTADINGGTIDGTVIGGASTAAGSFTSVSASGNITVTGTVDGRDVAADGSKLDGIEAGADVTDTANVTSAGALMDSELTNLAAVKAINQSLTTTSSPSFSNITVSGTVDGRDVSVDGSKLDGIAAGAQVNVATNLTYSTASTTGTVNSSTGTNATIPAATTSLAGLLTGSDKTKLNGIASGAQVNVATNLTYSTGATTGTVNSSTGTNATIPAATVSLAGLLTGADKTKLNGIETGADVTDATNVTAAGALMDSECTNLAAVKAINQGLTTTSDVRFDSFGVGTNASGTTGEIRATNNITAFYSDKRLKENINLIDNALDKLNKISGVMFTPNEVAAGYGYDRSKNYPGVIAQEIKAVLPEAVVPAPFDTSYDDDGNQFSVSGEDYMTVQYEKLIPLLIQAVKELDKKVTALGEK